MKRKTPPAPRSRSHKAALVTEYDTILSTLVQLLETARRTAARSVNAVMTASYWEIGRRIVEFEQGGQTRAGYGEQLLERLSHDLTQRFGRGFGMVNLHQMRKFYLAWPPQKILQTVSEESGIRRISQTPSAKFDLTEIGRRFPLPWSHYVRLLSVKDEKARAFYEEEALHGGWSVRQLDRQISTQFYQRILLSRNKAAMLTKGAQAKPEDAVTPEEEIKDPFVLEFLGLKDEYSESELEEALIRHLQSFLLELGNDFAFIGRQKRLRIGDQWFVVDLIFFHRRLRCLLIVDLKIGTFTHADAGQMHMYLNYAREHWTHPDENPPVGLILCDEKSDAVVHYALENLPNKILAREYLTALPDKTLIEEEMVRTRHLLETRRTIKGDPKPEPHKAKSKGKRTR